MSAKFKDPGTRPNVVRAKRLLRKYNDILEGRAAYDPLVLRELRRDLSRIKTGGLPVSIAQRLEELRSQAWFMEHAHNLRMEEMQKRRFRVLWSEKAYA